MTKESKIILSVAGALATGLIINYLLHTEKGSEVGQQLRNAASDFFSKGKDMFGKAKYDTESKMRETTS